MSDTSTTLQTDAARDSIARLQTAYTAIRTQMSQVIVGQSDVIDQLLISLFSRGHCLLDGVPGLAKTLMISTLARTLSMTFSRIQFTPDLMPADITGTDVLQQNKTTGEREFRFIQGPLFHNVVLADEINRKSSSSNSALVISPCAAFTCTRSGSGPPRWNVKNWSDPLICQSTESTGRSPKRSRTAVRARSNAEAGCRAWLSDTGEVTWASVSFCASSAPNSC